MEAFTLLVCQTFGIKCEYNIEIKKLLTLSHTTCEAVVTGCSCWASHNNGSIHASCVSNSWYKI